MHREAGMCREATVAGKRGKGEEREDETCSHEKYPGYSESAGGDRRQWR